MKYYHKIFKYKDGNGTMYEMETGYYKGENMPSLNQPIYGFSYDINDDTKKSRLISKPILGEILDYESSKLKNINSKCFSNYVFVPYKKDNKSFRKSGIVDIDSRWYADTYEEAVEMYNELVQKRIDKLQKMIEEAKGDLI